VSRKSAQRWRVLTHTHTHTHTHISKMEENMKEAQLMGTLRRKKNEHGVFEDAWKTKV
jgi:hypothetical protein